MPVANGYEKRILSWVELSSLIFLVIFILLGLIFAGNVFLDHCYYTLHPIRLQYLITFFTLTLSSILGPFHA